LLLLFRQTARFYFFREKFRSCLSVTKVRDNKHEEALKRREGGEFATFIFFCLSFILFFLIFFFFFMFFGNIIFCVNSKRQL
jgi:hypothetical protein